jgi:RHS repeat-associated protein
MSGGVRGLLSQWRNGARYYYHFDGLGSVMQVTDGSQNVVARYKYDAWGNDLVDLQSPLPNPFKYVGGLGYYADRDSGLMLLGKRYYCAGVGRFWSLDPAKDGFNWYENALNQLVSLTDENGTRVFSYDANGNCVNDGKRLYEWDVQNRLIRVIVPNEGEVRFRYRADGMRVEKQVVGGLTTKYVYDGQTVIGEMRSDGTKRWYVLGAMGYVCRIDEDANGQILARDYFVYDGLGSCRALVSSNGIVVAKYDYDVYGSVRGQEGQRANSFKYVAQIGHPTDEETGLIYMRARYYDPEIGRFISEDPGFNRVNWYQYADGNPVNRLDGNGRSSAAIDALFGNLFIILGFLLMGDNVEINWDKVFDYVRAKLVEIVIFSWEEEPKVLAKWTNFAWDMIKMLKELDEIDVSGKAFTRWLGYYITIMGQMLLTEADIAEPGFYDWWGYDVVSNKWFP